MHVEELCEPKQLGQRPYDLIYVRRDKTLLIIVHRTFHMEHWAELEKIARQADEENYYQVDIDMRELNFFNSMLLGIMMKLNAELLQTRCQLRLIVETGSRLESIFHLAKLDRILTIWSTRRVQAVSPRTESWLMAS